MQQMMERYFLMAWCAMAAFTVTAAASVWAVFLSLVLKAVRDRRHVRNAARPGVASKPGRAATPAHDPDAITVSHPHFPF